MRTCIVCGQPIGQGHLRYCSHECANSMMTARKLEARMQERKIVGYVRLTACIVCDKETTRGMYCSRECEVKQQVKTLGFKARMSERERAG